MGHLINPISIRLGLNNYWNFNWALNNNYNYPYMTKNNIFFSKFLNWILKSKKFNKKNIIFSHYNIYINNNNVTYINVYYYNPYLEDLKYKNNIYSKSIEFFKNKNNKKIDNFKQYKYINLYKYLINYVFTHLYWFIISNYWKKYLNKTFLNKIKYKISVSNIDLENISANIITTYIGSRLQNKHRLNYTIKPVLRDLHLRLKEKRIIGYKILCAGRFTRRQIAEHNWYKKGAITNNTFLSFIDYSQIKVRLKYGVCGIKVWINYGDKKNSSITKFYKLILPITNLTYYKKKTYMNNVLLFIKNSTWFFVNIKFKNFKFNIKDYKSYLKNKFLNIIYINFFFKLKKEFNYILKNKKKFNKLHSIFLMYFIKLNFNSQSFLIQNDLKKLQNNNNKIYIYE